MPRPAKNSARLKSNHLVFQHGMETKTPYKSFDSKRRHWGNMLMLRVASREHGTRHS